MTTRSSRPTESNFSMRVMGGVSYVVCEPLEKAGFINAFTTRSAGDQTVLENRQRFTAALGHKRPVFICQQTHSTRAHVIAKDTAWTDEVIEGDALLTPRADVLVGVKSADCVPLLIGDTATHTAVAVHAGWRGTLSRITEKTLKRLDASACVVAIGPSACRECYQVGADVAQGFEKEFSYGSELLQKPSSDGKAYLDVARANVRQLMDAGVPPQNIYVSSACTMHDAGLFYSHRREGKTADVKVGRMIALIGRF